MRVLVEALGLSSYGGKQVGLGIFRELEKHRAHNFTVVVPDIPEYGAISAPNVTKVLMRKPVGLVARDAFLNRELKKLCDDQRADVLLCMGSFIPRSLPCPTVLFLQLPYLVYKERTAEKRLSIRERLIVCYGRMLYRRLPERVPVIVQIESVKRRLISLYGIDADRIYVVPNALPMLSSYVTTRPHSVRGAKDPFVFLCLGRYCAHKNVEILLDALQRLSRYTDVPARCVINISAAHHPSARRFIRKLQKAGSQCGLVQIEPVSREELPNVYWSADAYVFPTLLETFSFTYDEAMHFGLPIVTSDRDFARERCRDAAVYFDPLDADSVARAMASVMDDAGLRGRLVENGRRIVAESPTWDEITTRFVEVLECVATRERIPKSRSAPTSHVAVQSSCRSNDVA